MGIKFHNLLILKKESRPTFRVVDVFIYHLYDWSIREAAAFRDTNGLGNLQIFTDDCNIAADFNWYGGRRLALYRIPDSDCDWDYHTAL